MRFNYRSAAVLVALIYNRPRGPGTKRGGKKTSVQGRRECRPQNSPSLLRFSQLLFFFRAIVRTGWDETFEECESLFRENLNFEISLFVFFFSFVN